MGAGVAAVVVDAIFKLGKDIVKEKSVFSIVVMAVTFVAVFLLDADVKLVIVCCAAVGIANAYYLRAMKKKVGGGGKDE